jgi:hypothetical protein
MASGKSLFSHLILNGKTIFFKKRKHHNYGVSFHFFTKAELFTKASLRGIKQYSKNVTVNNKLSL